MSLSYKQFYRLESDTFLKSEYDWCLKQLSEYTDPFVLNFYKSQLEWIKNILAERSNLNLIIIPNRIIQQIKNQ